MREVAMRQVAQPLLRASSAPYCSARYMNIAPRGGGGATHRHSLSTCHPKCASVVVKEDTAAVAKLLLVRLIS